MKDYKNSAGNEGRGNKRPRITTPRTVPNNPRPTRRIGGRNLDEDAAGKSTGYSKSPRFSKGKSDYNKEDKPSFRKGSSDYSRDGKPGFRKGGSDYNKDSKSSFRKGNNEYSRDSKPSFRKDNSDYNKEVKSFFRKSDSDYKNSKPSFRKDDADYRGGKPSFRKNDADFRGGKPSFRKDNSDYKSSKPGFRKDDSDFRGGKPSFRKDSSDYKSSKPSFRKDDSDFRGSKPSFRKDDSDYRSGNPSFRKNDSDFRGGKSFRDSDSYKGKRDYNADGDRDERRTFRKSDDDSRGGYRGKAGSSYGKKPYGKRDGGFRSRPENSSGKLYGERRFQKSHEDDDRDFRKKGRIAKTYGRPQGRFKEAPEYEVLKKAPTSAKEKTEGVRLNRYLANAGISSRREADELIVNGQVKINGEVVTEMGLRVMPGDEVRFNNKVVSREKKVYVLLNKPKDFITTMDDPEGRRTVMELVSSACDERIYPVGRLDRMTTGLLLLTNDGELTEKLTHPSFNIRKIYQVELDRPITKADFEQLTEGITLDDGPVPIDDLAIVSEDKTTLGIEIHIGRNRIVRRLFEHLGYEVVKLDRVVYAGLTKSDLPRGKWRFLSEKEVGRLVKPHKRSKSKPSKDIVKEFED